MKRGRRKSSLLNLLCDIIGSVLYSVGLYTFASEADFAPGGISGLAIILNAVWNLPIGIMTIVLNIPFVILSYRIVGREFLVKTTRTMIFCTFFLDIVFPHIPKYTGSPFLAALYAGICLGAGLTLFYMRGSSSGGTDFLIMTIKALKPHISIGMVTTVVDLAVIFVGWPVFDNVDAVLYGLVATLATSIVIDKAMYGIGAGKLIISITDEEKKIAEKIGEVTGRGSTIISAKGSYTNQERAVLLCACSTSQVYSIRRIIYETDPRAFVMLTETSEVFGEGFIEKKP